MFDDFLWLLNVVSCYLFVLENQFFHSESSATKCSLIILWLLDLYWLDIPELHEVFFTYFSEYHIDYSGNQWLQCLSPSNWNMELHCYGRLLKVEFLWWPAVWILFLFTHFGVLHKVLILCQAILKIIHKVFSCNFKLKIDKIDQH